MTVLPPDTSRDIAKQVVLAAVCTSLLLSSAYAESGPGLWTSASELQGIPQTGPAWKQVKRAADRPNWQPDIANQDEVTNTSALAAGIVYARTGDETYRTRVVGAIRILVKRGDPGGRSLAWARKAGTYALAADLVGYHDAEFDRWLNRITDVYRCSQLKCTLREMFLRRPNNWGTHAFGTLVAIDAYLNKRDALGAVRDSFVRSVTQGERATSLRFTPPFGWHPSVENKFVINPAGAVKNGLSIDGLLPDDMRRGSDFAIPPVFTGYAWEGLQGLIMGARILERVEMPIWESGDRALFRAVSALHVRFADRFGETWRAQGDDEWMIRFVNDAYGTALTIGPDRGWGHGKNVGFAYVLLRQTDGVHRRVR